MTVPVPVPEAAAVKVTGVFTHTGPEGLAASATEGVSVGFNNIEMPLEAALLVVKQVPPLTAISQETISPLASDVPVNVFEELLCTGFPLILKV